MSGAKLTSFRENPFQALGCIRLASTLWRVTNMTTPLSLTYSRYTGTEVRIRSIWAPSADPGSRKCSAVLSSLSARANYARIRSMVCLS
jgi:hypothetical protein